MMELERGEGSPGTFPIYIFLERVKIEKNRKYEKY
jgi:hypothetical protein